MRENGRTTVGRPVWGPKPPMDELPRIDIWSPKVGYPVKLVVVNPEMLACYTHWYEERGHAHFEPPEACPGCRAGHASRWKGYLGCIAPGTGKLVLGEVTLNAVRSCPALLGGEGSLRGSLVHLWRRGKTRNSPVECLLERRAPTAGLPAPFDMARALYRVWHVRPTVECEIRHSTDGARLHVASPENVPPAGPIDSIVEIDWLPPGGEE